MTAAHSNSAPSGEKLCIACREPIPADAHVCFRCRAAQTPEKTSWSKAGLAWVGGITAVIGLITALSGVVGPVKGWWKQGKQQNVLLVAGAKQVELGEYSAAFDTYDQILKDEPFNIEAAHARLDTAMRWIEDFRVTGETDAAMQENARAIFARITPVLEAGLTNSNGYRAADVVAHLGWLNHLKEHLLYEDVQVEANFERALSMDPANVYGHAMLGSWLLEQHRSLADAKAHFAAALKTGKAKAFVRGCELGAMIDNDDPGVRTELVRVLNQMRKDGDAIPDEERSRVHPAFSASTGSEQYLRETLSAVPAEEAWATYQWIDRPLNDWAPFDAVEQRFIRATIDELAGRKSEALTLFRQLEAETKGEDGTLSRRIHAAVQRLSK